MTDQDLPVPDVAELVQREDDPLLVVPIRAVGPLGVHELPARTAICRTFDLTTTFDKILSGPDPKRKRVLLFPSAAAWIATSTQSGGGCKLPAAAVDGIEIRHQGPICMRADSGTATVGVIVEVYAD